LTRLTLTVATYLAIAAAAYPLGALSAGFSSGGGCTQEYGYSGVVGAHAAAGVGARLTALDPPVVHWGHVAGWVGLSSDTAGSSSWIQAGLAGFEAGANTLYYEVAHPHAALVYTALRYDVTTGETHDVAVLEMAGHPGIWRVWLDGSPASGPIALAGSHHAWRPMVMAESWNGGTGVCNVFRFAFADVRTVSTLGAAWHRLIAAPQRVDPGYRLVDTGGRLLASTAP